MVSPAAFAAMVFTLLLCFLMPVVLFMFVRRKSKNITGAAIAGAAAFYLSQMVIRIPLLQTVLPRFEWYRSFSQDAGNALLFILLLGLSAALFEETARYLAFQLLLKERQCWKCGIAFGIGHGGIEAILLVGFTYINNIVLSIMINQNSFYSFLEGKVDSMTAESIHYALVNTPSGQFMAAGVERTMTIIIHIALSLLILEGIVRKRRLIFYLLAVGGHTAVNFASVYMTYLKVHYWFVELFIALAAAGGLLYIITSKKRFSSRIEAEDEAEQAVKEGY